MFTQILIADLKATAFEGFLVAGIRSGAIFLSAQELIMLLELSNEPET
jgi:hypothetical protein